LDGYENSIQTCYSGSPFRRVLSDYATLMVEILKDNARTEAGKLYAAMDTGWAELFGLSPSPTESKQDCRCDHLTDPLAGGGNQRYAPFVFSA
jgi:hypothetical protein